MRCTNSILILSKFIFYRQLVRLFSSGYFPGNLIPNLPSTSSAVAATFQDHHWGNNSFPFNTLSVPSGPITHHLFFLCLFFFMAFYTSFHFSLIATCTHSDWFCKSLAWPSCWHAWFPFCAKSEMKSSRSRVVFVYTYICWIRHFAPNINK